MSRLTQVLLLVAGTCLYGGITLFARPSQTVPVHSDNSLEKPYYPAIASTITVWALPLSLAATQGIDVSFFSCGY